MIRGEVKATGAAAIPLSLRNASGQEETVEAIVDTGFSDYLALPLDLVAQLQLPLFGTARYEVGDGREVEFPIHTVTLVWEGQDREVRALASEGGALVGMRLLRGYRLCIDVVDGGPLTIEAL